MQPPTFIFYGSLIGLLATTEHVWDRKVYSHGRPQVGARGSSAPPESGIGSAHSAQWHRYEGAGSQRSDTIKVLSSPPISVVWLRALFPAQSSGELGGAVSWERWAAGYQRSPPLATPFSCQGEETAALTRFPAQLIACSIPSPWPITEGQSKVTRRASWDM